MKKQLMMAAAVAFTMGTTNASIWLDGQIKSEDMVGYMEGLNANDDIDGLYQVESFHTVSNGEGLWGIANDNGMTVDELKALNPFLDEQKWLFTGDQLDIGMGMETLYFEDMVDTSKDFNDRLRFNDYDLTTTWDDDDRSSARTVYSSVEGQTYGEVAESIKGRYKSDFGYQAEVVSGYTSGEKVTYTRQRDGTYLSDVGNHEFTYDQVNARSERRSSMVPATQSDIDLETRRIQNKAKSMGVPNWKDQKWVDSNNNVVKVGDEIHGFKRVTEEATKYVGANIEDMLKDMNSDQFQYTVKDGDGAWLIAHNNGISLQELYDFNEGLEGRAIYTGEVFNVRDMDSVITANIDLVVKEWGTADLPNMVHSKIYEPVFLEALKSSTDGGTAIKLEQGYSIKAFIPMIPKIR